MYALEPDTLIESPIVAFDVIVASDAKDTSPVVSKVPLINAFATDI